MTHTNAHRLASKRGQFGELVRGMLKAPLLNPRDYKSQTSKIGPRGGNVIISKEGKRKQIIYENY